MSLGGGVFTTQNKKLPGSYINFVSAQNANASLGERGTCAFVMPLSWGEPEAYITLTHENFLYDSEKLLGYEYSHEKMRFLREAFCNATEVILYRANTDAVKASNKFADAKYGGVRGNDLKIVITANVDEPEKFDVKTLLGTKEVDSQKAKSSTDDLVSNDFLNFKAGVALELTASTPLTGGTDGTTDISTYQSAFRTLECVSFNVIGIPVGETSEIKKLAIEWTKRMRDEVGIKFQCVIYNADSPNHEGIVNLASTIEWQTNDPSLVYWVTGALAGCKVYESLTNKIYNGEYDVKANLSQSQLEDSIDAGQFVFHRVGDEVRVLTDINSLTDITKEKGEDFKSNQTIRVLDQIGNDIASLFNDRFLGKVPNDDAGRVSLWNEIVKHHQELLRLRAIEDFMPEDITVAKGSDKKSVVITDNVTPTNALEKLYMTVIVN